MTRSESKPPGCFGNLEIVFPMGQNGLRDTPEPCLACPFKVACLKSAIQGRDGLKVREEQIDRAYESGMIGFFERWSKKKAIERRKKSQ